MNHLRKIGFRLHSDITPYYGESVKLADSLTLQLKKPINEKY